MKKEYLSPVMQTVIIQETKIIALSDIQSSGLGDGKELNYDKSGGRQSDVWVKGNRGSVDWDDDWSN